MGDFPSGTVTFLFTDVDGSTRLLKRLRSRYGEVLAEHRRLLRAVFSEYGGREIDNQGDSFFVAFGRAKDAVRAAVASQRALAEHPWSEGDEVRVRMALHTGEPELSEEGYFGLGVHRAARICAAGHGGQILLSRSTAGVFDEDEIPGVTLMDLGERRLKDLERAERIYQVVAEGLRDNFPALNTVDRDERERKLVEAVRDAELPGGTLTFLFSDMEGFGRLGSLPGREAIRTIDEHDLLLRSAFMEAGGRVVESFLDSFLVCFPTAKQAVAGATSAQRALSAHEWPSDAKVAVRIGLHTGEGIPVGQRYFGSAVYRTANVCEAARGGQVLLSPSTVALLDPDDLGDLSLSDVGEHELAGFGGPVRLLELVIPGPEGPQGAQSGPR
jgi:class 3 adenylate cyclase